MAMEQKTAILYVRCKPSVKDFITSKAEKAGYSTLANWFEEFFMEEIRKEREKRPRKRRKLS